MTKPKYYSQEEEFAAATQIASDITTGIYPPICRRYAAEMLNATIPSTAIVPDKPPRLWRRLPLRMFVVIVVVLGLGTVAIVGVPVYLHQSPLRTIESVGGELVAMNGSSHEIDPQITQIATD